MILALGDVFPSYPRLSRRLLMMAAAVGAVLWAPWKLDWRSLAVPLDNPQEQAYDFALRHPGEAYFPWQPLSTLLAEGRLDHFNFQVHARTAAGYPLSQEHFEAYIPPDLQFVFFRPKARDYSVLQYLLEFKHRTTHPEMPGWEVFVRD